MKSTFFGMIPIFTISINPFLLIKFYWIAFGPAHGLCLCYDFSKIYGFDILPRQSLPFSEFTFGNWFVYNGMGFFLYAVTARISVFIYFVSIFLLLYVLKLVIGNCFAKFVTLFDRLVGLFVKEGWRIEGLLFLGEAARECNIN